MRTWIAPALGLLAAIAPQAAADDIFPPGAKLKVEAEGGLGGEGPAWHPKLGVLCSGNGGTLDHHATLVLGAHPRA